MKRPSTTALIAAGFFSEAEAAVSLRSMSPIDRRALGPLGLRPIASIAIALLVGGCDAPAGGTPGAPKGACVEGRGGAGPAPDPGAELSYTRLLRRVDLSLLGRPPAYEDYEKILAAPDDAARDAMIDGAIESALASKEFYRALVSYGHDYLRTSAMNRGGVNVNDWVGSQMAMMEQCPATSKHPGAFYVFGADYPEFGDPESYCYDLDREGRRFLPLVRSIEPWWAPGREVTVIGRAGSGVREHDGIDCGRVYVGLHGIALNDSHDKPLCSCGPNLVYCIPRMWGGRASMSAVSGTNGYGSNDFEDSQRRQGWDEPARLFAHIAWNDRPLSDLVLANYSVAPFALQTLYVKMGRRTSANKALDDLRFWDPSTWHGPADPEHDPRDPLAWREFVVETLNPNLLALSPNGAPSGSLDRTYRFDPRTTTDAPIGFGAAGVLTSMGALSSFARERVRAARWLETFACVSFVPPPPDAQFNAFQRDPATEGVCQHCHALMDLAAIHFKRWDFDGQVNVPMMGGVGDWSWPSDASKEPWARWEATYIHDTKLTPATEAEIAANPNARFIDFLPPDEKLFGTTSDGTIGPLGFGKILVQSGEFDKCAVQRLYERFVGRKIDPSTEQPFVEKLVGEFVAHDRALRPFLRYVLHTDQFRRGL